MGQATITLKYVDAPKPGKKMGSISDGKQRYWVWGNEIGKFEVGKTYSFKFKDSDNTGTFLTVVGAPEVVQQSTNGHSVAKAGNGNGEIDIRSIFGLMHSYNGKLPPIPQMLQDLRNAQAALQAFENNESLDFNDSLEDTF